MKASMTILGLMLISGSVFARGPSQFCAGQAGAAAQALANVNGSVSAVVQSSMTANGTVFNVVLSEEGLGRDAYTVTTSGGHDCMISSVKVDGQPTLRP